MFGQRSDLMWFSFEQRRHNQGHRIDIFRVWWVVLSTECRFAGIGRLEMISLVHLAADRLRRILCVWRGGGSEEMERIRIWAYPLLCLLHPFLLVPILLQSLAIQTSYSFCWGACSMVLVSSILLFITYLSLYLIVNSKHITLSILYWQSIISCTLIYIHAYCLKNQAWDNLIYVNSRSTGNIPDHALLI